MKGDPQAVPNSMYDLFNSAAEVDLPKGGTTFRCDIALERGIARNIRVVDPQGRPAVAPGSRAISVPVTGALLRRRPSFASRVCVAARRAGCTPCSKAECSRVGSSSCRWSGPRRAETPAMGDGRGTTG